MDAQSAAVVLVEIHPTQKAQTVLIRNSDHSHSSRAVVVVV
jgi:hypothetical protein